MKKITAIVNLPGVDQGIKKAYFKDGSFFEEGMLDLNGKRLILEKFEDFLKRYSYIYTSPNRCESFYFKTSWLKDIQEEPESVDWSNVAVDTKILVRSNEGYAWEKRYFAKYEDGKIFAWNDGCTSWTCTRHNFWNEAKLAEE